MGTTGTIMGVSTYLKSRNANVQVIGAQPAEGSQIPGIRKWPEAYMPSIFDRSLVDGYESIAQVEAETMARRLAAEERSEEHTSELQSLMRISYAVFCLKKKKNSKIIRIHDIHTYNK